MRTMTFLHSVYSTIRVKTSTGFSLPKFKDHVNLFDAQQSSIYICSNSYKSNAKISEFWLGNINKLFHIESDNILVGRSIILDADTLDILMVTLISKKYVEFNDNNSINKILCNTKLGYLDSCLEIYVSQNFVGSKAFNKLLPNISNIKLFVLPHTELKKLHE